MKRALYPVLMLAALASGLACAQDTTFDCRLASGSIENMICKDTDLAALDRQMVQVLRAAAGSVAASPLLQAEQRGWVSGRNDCWKNTDRRQCVIEAYQQRMAELQVRYRLLPAAPAQEWWCDGGHDLVIRHFATRPPALLAEGRGQTVVLYRQPAAAYAGGNARWQEDQGVGRLDWGDGSLPLRCRVPGSASWLAAVDQAVNSRDGQGHGPDIGSVEWQRVISLRLGLVSTLVPGSRPWWRALQQQVLDTLPR